MHFVGAQYLLDQFQEDVQYDQKKRRSFRLNSISEDDCFRPFHIRIWCSLLMHAIHLIIDPRSSFLLDSTTFRS